MLSLQFAFCGIKSALFKSFHFGHQTSTRQCLPHEIPHPLFCYHRLRDIQKYGFEVVQNSAASTSTFIRIRLVVLEYNWTDQPIMSSLYAIHAKKA